MMFPALAPINSAPVVTFLFVSPAVFCPDHEKMSGEIPGYTEMM